MPEVIFSGAEGRLEGRYHHNPNPDSPIAVVLHPHPLYGGTMNNKIVYRTFQSFVKNGFSVLRFNFRGVGRSQGKFADGEGELGDAATAMDWVQRHNPDASSCWIGGFSFGAWIALQLLMRRPEIEGFVAISPPANMYDFSFLSPCPTSGYIAQGDRDDIVDIDDVNRLTDKLMSQKNINIHYDVFTGSDHYFRTHLDELGSNVDRYIARRLVELKKERAARLDRKRRQPQPD